MITIAPGINVTQELVDDLQNLFGIDIYDFVKNGKDVVGSDKNGNAITVRLTSDNKIIVEKADIQ